MTDPGTGSWQLEAVGKGSTEGAFQCPVSGILQIDVRLDEFVCIVAQRDRVMAVGGGWRWQHGLGNLVSC